MIALVVAYFVVGALFGVQQLVGGILPACWIMGGNLAKDWDWIVVSTLMCVFLWPYVMWDMWREESAGL